MRKTNTSDPLMLFQEQLKQGAEMLMHERLQIHKKKNRKDQTTRLPRINGNSVHSYCNYGTLTPKIESINERIQRIQRDKEIEIRLKERMKGLEIFNNNYQDLYYRRTRMEVNPYLLPYQLQYPVPARLPSRQPSQHSHYQKSSSKIPTVKKIEKVTFSKEAKQKLKRKFRIISKVVFFSVIYPKYSKTVFNLKYKNYCKINKLSYISQAIAPLKTLFTSIEFYNIFDRIIQEKNKANAMKSEMFVDVEGQEVSIVNGDTEFVIDIMVSIKFTMNIILEVQKFVRKGLLKSLYPIISSFVDGNFPLNHTLLSTELCSMKFNKESGRCILDQNISKILIINFIFIKLLIFNILNENSLPQHLKQAYKDKTKYKKLIIINGRKIKISFILFYTMLNSIFQSHSSDQKTNYNKLSENLKAIPMSDLEYEYLLEKNSSYKEEEVNLIKGIKFNQFIFNLYSENFEECWKKISEISAYLLNEAMAEERKGFMMVLESGKNGKLQGKKSAVVINNEAKGEQDGLNWKKNKKKNK